jgi:hypothetical protein
MNRGPLRVSIALAGLLAAVSVWARAETPSAPVKIAGTIFESTASFAGYDLPFRGGTLCRHKAFRVYTAALFVQAGARTREEVLGPVPKRLILHYHRDIDREDIVEASERTLRKNPRIDMKRLRERLDRIYSWYENVREGDRFWLDYMPGKGSELFFNGVSKGVIEGDDFAAAYFGIWLSDHSLSEKYRRRLLGESK